MLGGSKNRMDLSFLLAVEAIAYSKRLFEHGTTGRKYSVGSSKASDTASSVQLTGRLVHKLL